MNNITGLTPDRIRRRHEKAEALLRRMPRARRFTPYFWDRLSDVHLTWSALRELARRKNVREFDERAEAAALAVQQQQHATQQQHQAQQPNTLPRGRRMGDPGIARFARNGGPDLTDLRENAQWPNHAAQMHEDIIMPEVASTLPKFTHFHADFDQHLRDYQIYPLGSPENQSPANLEELLVMLGEPLRTPGPGVASEYTHGIETWSDFFIIGFQDFLYDDPHDKIIQKKVIPPFFETTWSDDCTWFYTRFEDVEALTDESIAPPFPAIVDGAPTITLVPNLMEDYRLRRLINVNGMAGDVVAGNFFFDEGNETQQSCFEGAFGARTMHTLTNLPDKIRHETTCSKTNEYKPYYDNHARSFTTTLAHGTLHIMAHHVTKPEGQATRPRYHMTTLARINMLGTVEGFREGFRALRNVRAFARRERDQCIQAANIARREADFGHSG